MADALVAGVQYGLSSRSSSENNALIAVKLTDSAYRAIEEYLKNGDRTKQKPTIQFLNNEGHLSIPSSQSGPHSHVFNFSLAPTAQAEEGTFDCLRSQGGRTLHSVGAPTHQMCIKANDDVYETTRHRMAAAEQQSKKNCTRVIKPNTADIGRKVKLKTGNMAEVRNGVVSALYPPPQPTQPVTSRVPTITSVHSRAMTNNHAQKPGNSDITRRPIKERLIHLLALRPYKKPELLDRIYKEGIKEREKKMVTPALSQISTMRDNTYYLIRRMWNDVQEDWPFYCEQERNMLKRKKPQNLTPPGSSDSGSGQSPSSTHPGSPPSATVPKRSGYLDLDMPKPNGYVDLDAVATNKRPGYFETADGLQSKRQRISHFRKPTPAPPDPPPHTKHDNLYRDNMKHEFNYRTDHTKLEPSYGDNAKVEPAYAMDQSKMEPNYGADLMKHEPTFRTDRPDRNSPNIKRSESPATVTSSQPAIPGDVMTSSSPQHRDTCFDLGNIQENTVSASELPEYIMEYTLIKDSVQRRKYKEVFNQDYDEYKKLHAAVEQVSHKFSTLENELARASPGTVDYKRIKRQVWKEYHENQQDSKYHEAKRRFLYLHEKLSHIKKLVADYDASIDY